MARGKVKRAAKAKTKKTVAKRKAAKPAKPIELYYWPTPNGFKISIMLEECGLPYTLVPVNISKGEQFKPDFLKISPNNRMPAIIDPARPRRTADLDLRVRRHPAISRPQDRQVLSERRAPARRSRAVAVLADGRRRPDGGAGASLQELRGGDADLRDQPLHQRGQPALRRDEPAAQGSRIHRRQIFHRRHGAGRLGQWLGAAGAEHQRVSQPQALAGDA